MSNHCNSDTIFPLIFPVTFIFFLFFSLKATPLLKLYHEKCASTAFPEWFFWIIASSSSHFRLMILLHLYDILKIGDWHGFHCCPCHSFPRPFLSFYIPVHPVDNPRCASDWRLINQLFQVNWNQTERKKKAILFRNLFCF